MHGTRTIFAIAFLLVPFLIPAGAVGAAVPQEAAHEGDFLYRIEMIRAAPGDLLEVIDMIGARMPVWEAGGPGRPFWMRHSQGDHWDLMLVFPMAGFAEYWSGDAIARRERAWDDAGETEAGFRDRLRPHVSWREEWYVEGPAYEALAARFEGAGLFHVEIFLALAGERDALLEQRRMENRYYEVLERDQNVILSRVGGAPWDVVTIGFYDDLQDFAAGDAPEELQERAAREAGFEGAGFIGSYLRSLIAEHHDTLAVAIR